MDKELLQKLGNLADSLDAIAQALDKSKGAATSATGTALQSGDFSKSIEQISVGIRSIKADTKKILDNQETIIKMQKQNSGKETQIFEDGGKKKELIKDGVGAIILIAGAVLAIGAAFNILGDVPISTVLGLSIALPILAFTFQKLSKLDLNLGKVALIGGLMTIISLSIVLSSKILQYVSPIDEEKTNTIVKIGEIFIAFNLVELVAGFSGMRRSDAMTASALMPLVLLALSFSIFASSYLLSGVKKVGTDQLITSLLISGAFLVFAYVAKPLLKSVKDISISDVKNGVLVLLALTGAVVGASYLVSLMGNVEYGQMFKFLALSFTVSASVLMIAATVKVVNKLDTLSNYIKGSVSIVALVTAIAVSSLILGIGRYENIPSLMWVVGSGLSILAFSLLSWGLNKLGSPKDYILGGLGVIAVSGAIAISSTVLNLGTYGNYPTVDWSLGVGLSILSFGLGVVGFGAIMTSGIGAVALGLGLVFLPLLALSIVATDKILSLGTYGKGNYPTVDWSSGVAISLIAFSTSVVLLGSIAASGIGIIALGLGGLAILGLSKVIVKTSDILSKGNYNKNYPGVGWSLGVGAALLGFSAVMAPLSLISPFLFFGGLATLGVAKTIVKTADILSKGKFSGGPTKEWAEGISLALGAFSPIYEMMVKNKIMSIFGKGVSVEDFTKAIRLISQGIVDAGNFFVGRSDVFKGGPSKEWAEGVGLSISAFAPVYKALSEGGIFSSVSVDDMTDAIHTIAEGIVSVAEYFSSNVVKFDPKNVPNEEWSDNVRSSIEAFAPVFDFISDNSGFFGSDIDDVSGAIVSIAESISNVSTAFASGNWSSYPTTAWIDGTSYAISKFKSILDAVSDINDSNTLIPFFGKSPLSEAVSNISLLGDAFAKLGNSVSKFSNSISSIDSEKLAAIRSLSSNVVLLSLMDPDQFEDMMDRMEEKSKVFASLMDSSKLNRDNNQKSGTVKVLTTGGGNVKSDSQILGEKVDRMTAILADISSVVGSKGTLKTYLGSLKDTQIIGSDNSPHNRSDKRLKNVIRKIGQSPGGINIYLFSYKFNPNIVYQGVLAQELIGTEYESSLLLDKNGFYSVDYTQIDVQFKKVETSEF